MAPRNRGPGLKVSSRTLGFVSILLVWAAFELGGSTPFAQDFERSGWEGSPGFHLHSEVRGLVPLRYSGGRLLATRAESIFSSADLGKTWSRLGRLEPRDYTRAAGWAQSVRNSRLGRAFLPGLSPEALLVLQSGTMLAVHPPWIQRSVDGGRSWRRIQEIPETERSVRLLRAVEDPTGRVWVVSGRSGAGASLFLGEDDARTWQEVEVKPVEAGEAPPVLGPATTIQLDPLRGRVWMASGGEGEAVQIGWLDADGSFRRVAGGKEEFRVGSLMFTSEYVYWASDAARGPYGIWRWSRIDDVVEQVTELPGPARHGTVLAAGSLVVASRVEGPGAHNLELWGSPDGDQWSSLVRSRVRNARTREGLASAVFPAGDPLPGLVFAVEGFGAQVPATVLADWHR